MLRLLQRLLAREGVARALGRLNGPFNPWLPDHRRDPYPMYRELRARPGLVRAPLLGAWIASRHADVERVLRDRAFTTDRSGLMWMRLARRAGRDAPDFRNLLENNLLMIDGRRHARLRGLVAKAFTPRRVQALEPRVAELVDELLAGAAAGGALDAVRDLAEPLPAIVIAELLGVPRADRERFRRWSDELVEILDPLSGREGLDPPIRATTALAGYFRELLAERRRAPRDDLLSALIAAEDAGQRLEESEVLALCGLLLAAGHETTTNAIGNGVLQLLRHPGERKRLVEDPALLPSAVEELLRIDSPVQMTDRVVAEDTELAGRRLRRGTLVGVVLGSANRDPERFPEPDRLDLARRDNRHLAFGLGNHVCLGAHLARLETRLALGGLLRRFPHLDGDPEPPGWKRSVVLRGPTAVPLRV